MKTRRTILAAIAALSLLPLGAQVLAREELETAAGARVAFINYEGPQSRIESAEAIRGIGSGLGGAMAGGRAGRAGAASRYAVIRVLDPALREGFDADIILIGAEAQVDHVVNLRRIIAGYLEAAWGYSGRDADTLATFITVYNAVHRRDLAYFGQRYKPAVLRELGPEDAGLSLRWDEWAGRSRILVPLGSGARPGSLGAVDTGAVSERAVVESLREEADRGVGDRQAMVDLKEREVEEGKAELEAEEEAIAREEAALAAERARLEAERAALEAERARAAAAGGAGEAGAGEAQEAELAVREAELRAAEEEAREAEAALAERKEEAEAAEAAIGAKEAEIAEDRGSIAQDQRALIAEEVGAKALAEAAGVYLFEVVDSSYPFARVVFVDAATGRLIRASTLNSIRSRTLLDAGEGFVAVAGREGGTGAVRLVKIDKASLGQVAEGRTDIHPESALARLGASFYAAARAPDGRHYLGRFGPELAEEARSAEAVNPLGFIADSPEGLIVQAAGGGFLLLDRASLALSRRLQP